MKCQQHNQQSKIVLQQGQLKATSGRLELLDIFSHAKKPLSVNDIFAIFKKSEIDKVTVYRNIDSLEKLGVIRQIIFKDRQSYYELSDRGHHHHAVCIGCGKIKDLSKCGLENIANKLLKESGFSKISEHSLEFFGVCSSCAK